MAAFRFRTFKDTQTLEHFLNGGIVGATLQKTEFFDLVGKTVVFTQPSSTTVTFTAGSSANKNQNVGLLTAKEVFDQLKAAVSGLEVKWFQQAQLAIIEASPSSGVTITGGTALPALGLTPLVGKVYHVMTGDAPPTAPYQVSLLINKDNAFVLQTVE